MTDLSQPSSVLQKRSRPRITIPFAAIEPLLAALDVAIIVIAGELGAVLYQVTLGSGLAEIGAAPTGLGLVASLGYVLMAHCLGLYRYSDLFGRPRDGRRIWASWAVAVLILIVVLFLFKAGADVSRGAVVGFFALGGLGLVSARPIAKRWLGGSLMKGSIRGRRAVVIGCQNELALQAPDLLLFRFGIDEAARIVLPSSRVAGWMPAQFQSSLVEQVRETPADEIVLALPWSQPHEIEHLLKLLRVFPLPVRLLPDRDVSTVLGRQMSMPQALYMVEVQRTPLMPFERFAKRALDIVVAALAMVMLTPLLILAAIAIKLESKGPVIFRQQRHGFNGKPFMIFKLRTMKVLEDGAAVVQATQRDPRVTRVGRVLRRSSIDELPQLCNVLLGHMSIVGPRPHALVHDYEYGRVIANYAFRHHVKPGITGWAQVQGYRGGTPRLELMERRITLDLWYINNWSLILDVAIILRTVFELTRQRNAY